MELKKHPRPIDAHSRQAILTLKVGQMMVCDQSPLIGLCMEDCKSLCIAVTICATLTDIHTDRQIDRQYFDQLI